MTPPLAQAASSSSSSRRPLPPVPSGPNSQTAAGQQHLDDRFLAGDLFASPIWSAEGPLIDALDGSSSSSSTVDDAERAGGGSYKPLPRRPSSPGRRRRRPPAPPPPLPSAGPNAIIGQRSSALLPTPTSALTSASAGVPATSPPPPPPQHPSLLATGHNPPPPWEICERAGAGAAPRTAAPSAPRPPPSSPPPIALPDELDPWTQQAAYDRRAAALRAAPSAGAGGSSSAAAGIAATRAESNRAVDDEAEQEDERRFEEAVRLSLAEVTLEGGGGRGRWEEWMPVSEITGQPTGDSGSRGGRGEREAASRRSERANAYNHTPPPQDSKALRAEEPTPIRSGASTQTTGGPSAPSSSSSSTAATGSTTFALELQAQNATLDRLRRWQAGALPASLEWHELVPPSVLLALDPPTAERQGLLWEIFRSEMEYVRNLEAGLNGFFTPLSLAPPSVLVGSPTAGEADRRAFIHETFFNLAAIFPGHSQMVYRLQERQLESHPVVDAIADILIEALIELLQPYELYLKHYPYAEARLRKELASNKAFADLIARLSQSPTVRKQDLLTFLVSPLSRLSKLALALDRLLKITPLGSDDSLGLPVVLDQIRGMLRAVQPGVDAASNKVRAWQVARQLRFRRGERNDLTLELESDERALLKIGRIHRRQRTERDWHGWTELCLVLFDNYLLITKEEMGAGGGQAGDEEDRVYAVVSRPIPLEFLAVVGSEHDPGEHRRDMVVDYVARRTHQKPFRMSNLLLDPLVQPEPDRQIFPFHLEHAGLRKGYTLFVESEEARREWLAAIKDQSAVRRVVLENNALFSVSPLTYSPPARVQARTSFSHPPALSRSTDSGLLSPPLSSSSSLLAAAGGDGPAPPPLRHHATSASFSSVRLSQSLALSEQQQSSGAITTHGSVVITAAATFERFEKEMFMVADSDGLSVGYRDDSRSHRRLVDSSSITDLRISPETDSLLLLATSTLYALELATLLPTADPDGWVRVRKDSGLTVSAWGESVTGFRLGRREGRPLVLYWCLNRLSGQSAIEVYEPLNSPPPSADTAAERSPSIRSVSSFSHPSSSSAGDGSRRPSGERKRAVVGYRHVASGSAVGAVYDVTFRGGLVAIAIDKGFIVADPLHLTASTANVPSYPETAQLKPVFSTLRSRVASFQPLLMHWLDDETAICVFETGCCWVDRRGAVAKSGAYITWETRATAAVVRGRSLILFAKDRRFVAVHDLFYGSLRQATEGRFRLVGAAGPGNVLAVQGEGQLVELLETVALPLHGGV